MKVIVRVNDKLYEVEIGDLNARPIVAVVEGETFEVWPEAIGSGAGPAPSAAPAPAQVPASAPAAKPQSDASAVHAPIPGVIVEIAVRPGDQVEPGQQVCVLEAMKMKNIIRSPRSGTISEIRVSTGQHVKHHDLLMEFAD